MRELRYNSIKTLPRQCSLFGAGLKLGAPDTQPSDVGVKEEVGFDQGLVR